MQLEVGKCYVDRKGRVFGPLSCVGLTLYGEGPTAAATWYSDGVYARDLETSMDLIAEHVPEPSSEWSMRDCCRIRPRKGRPTSRDPHMLETECISHVLRPGVDSVWNGNAWIPYTGEKTCLGMTTYARARFAKSAAPVALPRDINYIPRYADGWKPEAAVRGVAENMIHIIFNRYASSEERMMAASTLVEAVYPEILARKQ